MRFQSASMRHFVDMRLNFTIFTWRFFVKSKESIKNEKAKEGNKTDVFCKHLYTFSRFLFYFAISKRNTFHRFAIDRKAFKNTFYISFNSLLSSFKTDGCDFARR